MALMVFAFVVCRICGDHRRVISGRHLSKHCTDRETYMQEYDLSPDELLDAHDVSTVVNSAQYDGPVCIQPVSDDKIVSGRQLSLL